jgi:hypothetical protein
LGARARRRRSGPRALRRAPGRARGRLGGLGVASTATKV